MRKNIIACKGFDSFVEIIYKLVKMVHLIFIFSQIFYSSLGFGLPDFKIMHDIQEMKKDKS